MSFFECPYCKKGISSYLTFSYHALSGKKECGHCLGGIKLNFTRFLSVYMVGIPLFIVLLLFLYILNKHFNNLLLNIFIIVFIGNGLFYWIIQLLAKHFNYRMFSPIDDVDEHNKKLPSYLK